MNRISQLEGVLGQTALAGGWTDAAKLNAMVAELRAWAERPDSFGCAIWCAAVGWVDGDAPGVGA